MSISRIVDYLEDPTASHVQLQHFTPQESTRINTEKKSFLKSIDNTLNDNKK
ncbi:hypothetical protein N431DRAFT_439818 [Stipitochalara longipes BDJ]|nr:hypothetical protein N431DRAFT_439818 [Stipitochalara longipes BDJ]